MDLDQFKSFSQSRYPHLESLKHQLNDLIQDRISDFINSTLKSFGLDTETPDPNRLIVCDLKGYGSKAEAVGLCCDISNLSHTTVGLGVVNLLSQMKETLPNNFRVIFYKGQTNSSAASRLISDYLDEISSLWILMDNETLPHGSVGIKTGPVYVCSGEFTVSITPGAAELNVALVSSQIVIALRQLSNRKIDPLKPTEIQATSIKSIFSDEDFSTTIEIKGYYRTCDLQVAEHLPTQIQRVIQGFTKAYRVNSSFVVDRQSSASYNDKILSNIFLEAAREMLGSNRVLSIEYPLFISKDIGQLFHSHSTCVIEIGANNSSESNSSNLRGESAGRSFLFDCCSVLCWNFLNFTRCAD